jgi:putative alpha-1,2-mannosidase
MHIFVFASLTDVEGKLVSDARFHWNKDRFFVELPEEAPSSLLVKYAISYISHEQAEYNFDKEVAEKDFEELVAKGASRAKKYIQKAFINGEEIFTPFITHEEIMSGATLELVLSELPNKAWGN